jgi:hypothetical protein
MDEEIHLTEAEMLGMTHAAAAEVIGRVAEDFDQTGADFVLRNLAVITDRLSPQQFDALPKEVKDQVIVVAHVAHDVAPLEESDLERIPGETDSAFNYRTNIWGQLHALQRLVYGQEYDTDDTLMMSRLRFAVHAAGHAFAGVLEETAEVPVIKETMRYFTGNTEAARHSALRIGRLATENGS